MIPMCVPHSATPASLKFHTSVSHNFTSLYSSTGVEQARFIILISSNKVCGALLWILPTPHIKVLLLNQIGDSYSSNPTKQKKNKKTKT